MADVSHELGALRFVVESPLSSKVAMFNNAATKHQESQHLNPFSQSGGLSKRSFNKDEYGKPLAGSLTELRGQKANIHVLKEMLELCQIIDSEGYNVKDEPGMKVIPFGELFNIYTYISDKVVGILLRARKHKLIEFEGEVLFQRRDDDVPVFLLKPIKEIRQILEQKQEEIKRSVSPAPQATSVLIDKQKRAPSLSPTPTKPKTTNRSEKDIIKPIAKKAISTPNIKAESDKADDEIQNQIKGQPIAEEPSLKEVPTKISPTEEANSVPSDVTDKPTEPAKLTTNTNIQEQTSEDVQKTTEIILPTRTLPETIITPPETVITPPTPTATSAPEVKQTLIDIETTPLLVETDTPIVESCSAEVKQTKVESTTSIIQSEGTAIEPTIDQDTHVTASVATEVNHVEEINTSTIADQKTDLNNNEESLPTAVAGEQSLNTETEPPANTTTNTA